MKENIKQKRKIAPEKNTFYTKIVSSTIDIGYFFCNLAETTIEQWGIALV